MAAAVFFARTYSFVLLVLSCLLTCSVALADEVAVRRIVVIAGPKSHGPEGNGIHDYAWSARLIKTMLENSSVRDQVQVETWLNGWPTDAGALDDADAVMIISDGRDGEIGSEAPHLATANRVRRIEELVANGTGIVAFHFSTFAPDELAARVLEWYGGYFDWQTDGRREWYSNITTIKSMVTPATPGHEILRGVKPFTMREEFYFDVRFREQDSGWIPIWTADAVPHSKPNGGVVAWAVERPGDSRGFATTCGHFYDNWQLPEFRRTMLNGLAWAAHVKIPATGIEAEFFSHEQIAAHLEEVGLTATEQTSSADETIYADKPYWYKPGHPLKPAEPRAIETLPGFVVEKVLDVPEEFGSWTAITVDDRGRLICAAQHLPGLVRISPRDDLTTSGPPSIERLQNVASQIGWCHGLLAAFDSLYVTVTEDNDSLASGVYRLRDTDDDDQYDELRHIISLEGRGEHGPHNIVISPDGETLTMICGNGTRLPDDIVRHRPSRTEGRDHLMPPEFGDSPYSAEGFVMRFSPDGGEREILATGLRNSYDLAFNHRGDLFTFDSDMEWDLGAPWYRPTRICHLVSGGEFGWRGNAAPWPEYFEDSIAPVVNIGPGSPTGITFGYGTRFPDKYQKALFACDWTFATIHAVHLSPHGSSYRADVETFIGGNGLPVTDIATGADGRLYFLVGGRRLGSALYRVRHQDEASAIPFQPDEMPADVASLHDIRRRLESFHGRVDSTAIDAAWMNLGHDDRGIRFAARVALESQPVDYWRAAVLADSVKTSSAELSRRLAGLLALARRDSPANQVAVLDELAKLEFSDMSVEHWLRALRAYELALARGSDHEHSRHDKIRDQLLAHFPHDDNRVSRELARLLCFLQSEQAIEPLLNYMARDEGERPVLGDGYFVRNPKYGEAVRDILLAAPLIDRMHVALMMTWLDDGWSAEQQTRYFQLIADATQYSKGGYWYQEFWNRIREQALLTVPEAHRERFAVIEAHPLADGSQQPLPTPSGPGSDWDLNAILATVTTSFHDRSFEQGRTMFAAAKCITCHRFAGTGSAIGPDLSAIGQRFTLRDILDATLNPNKAVSDQYRVTLLVTTDGRTHSGRVVSRNETHLTLASNLMRPSQTTSIPLQSIDFEQPTTVSTMPDGLLDPLNADEILDLLAYLVSGGHPEHPVFETSSPN